MLLIGKLLALFLIMAMLGKWFWIALAVIALWYIIRFIADIFWWGKEEGKW